MRYCPKCLEEEEKKAKKEGRINEFKTRVFDRTIGNCQARSDVATYCPGHQKYVKKRKSGK